MATGYQVFQNGGGRTQPYLISEIRSTRGDVIYAHAASAPTPVLDPLYATRMVEMLKGVITGGTGTGANIGRPAAGKTGTSQDWRDAWFVGFTPDIADRGLGRQRQRRADGQGDRRRAAGDDLAPLHDRGREGPAAAATSPGWWPSRPTRRLDAADRLRGRDRRLPGRAARRRPPAATTGRPRTSGR